MKSLQRKGSSSSNSSRQAAKAKAPINEPSASKGQCPCPSRRSSWKFNTDWESATSNFRRRSSMLTSSMSSLYQTIDIDEEDGEKLFDDVKEEDAEEAKKRLSRKLFKRSSILSTLLNDEEDTSFHSSANSSQMTREVDDYLDSFIRADFDDAKDWNKL